MSRLASALVLTLALVAAGCHEMFGNQFYIRGVGDPCVRDADCGDVGVCIGCPSGGGCTGWCSPSSCGGDSDCEGSSGGKNGRGGENECLTSTDGASICFPGCASDDDCDAAWGDCVPASDDVRVCANNPYGRCSIDQDCASAGAGAFCNTNFGGCQAPCSAPSDCLGGGVCAQTNAGASACFPACITSSDCERYVGATCVSGTDPYGYTVQGCSS